MRKNFTQGVHNVAGHLQDSLGPLLPRYLPVVWKLGLAIGLLIAFGMAICGGLILHYQTQHMQQQADSFGQAAARQLADSSREPLLARDDFALDILLNNIISTDMLIGASIRSHDGSLRKTVGQAPEVLGNSPQLYRWQRGSETFTTHVQPVSVNEVSAGYVSATLSDRQIRQSQEQVKRTILLITLLMTAAGFVLAIFVSHRLVKPLMELLETARVLNQGQMQLTLKNKRTDEIGELIETYRHMARGLIEKNQIERVLARFISPSVARKLMKDLQEVSLGGNEVYASVVFADIVGFTRLSEVHDSETVAEILNSYFEVISQAANFYRGTIDKYMGDCAMITFGVTEPDSEHIFHALCCSVMIMKAVTRLNQERTRQQLPVVEMRIGLNSGNMLAGNLGSSERMQFTVVGDAVNIASRLSTMGQAGEIITTEEVIGNTNIRSRLHSSQSGTMRVRGRNLPVNTYRIEGVHRDSEQLMEQRLATFMQSQSSGEHP